MSSDINVEPLSSNSNEISDLIPFKENTKINKSNLNFEPSL